MTFLTFLSSKETVPEHQQACIVSPYYCPERVRGYVGVTSPCHEDTAPWSKKGQYRNRTKPPISATPPRRERLRQDPSTRKDWWWDEPHTPSYTIRRRPDTSQNLINLSFPLPQSMKLWHRLHYSFTLALQSDKDGIRPTTRLASGKIRAHHHFTQQRNVVMEEFRDGPWSGDQQVCKLEMTWHFGMGVIASSTGYLQYYFTC